MDSSDLEPYLIHGSLGPNESALKQYIDWFTRFCMAHERDQQTDTLIDRPRYSVCSQGHILCTE